MQILLDINLSFLQCNYRGSIRNNSFNNYTCRMKRGKCESVVIKEKGGKTKVVRKSKQEKFRLC